MKKNEIKQRVVDMKWAAQAKVTSFKEDVKETLRKAPDWISENKEVCIAFLVSVGAVVKQSISLYDHTQQRKQQMSVEWSVWDPNLGIYWYLKRPMTSSEKKRLMRETAGGVPVGEVLESMHILK
jgi:hypothetical protein